MEIVEHQIISLKPKSKKGKERLKRDGEKQWYVLGIEEKVLFSTEKGPWLHLVKVGAFKANTARWIHQNNDPDFEIVDEV